MELTPDQAKTYAILAIVGLFVIGALLSFLIAKVVVKLVIIAIVVGLGAFLWTQRAAIEEKVRDCDTDLVLVEIKLSPEQLKACQGLSDR